MCRGEGTEGLKPEISDEIAKCGTKTGLTHNTKFVKCTFLKKKITFANNNKQDARDPGTNTGLSR
jgi:hypothetical protein